MQRTLPIYEYPTTTIFVDDDVSFLQTLKSALTNHNTKTFSSPDDFVTFFSLYKKNHAKNKFLHGEHGHENYDLLEYSPVEFDVTSPATIRGNPNRFNEISVIVCDHSMPTITGLELFKQIHNATAKKVLLTGELQTSDTIAAFNAGLIDKYIPKRSSNLIKEIETSLVQLSRQYFCDQTNALLSHLEADNPLPLSDPAFVNFFNTWCKKHKIIEFYLIDKQGSFMVIDNQNKVSYFVVHTDNSLTKFSEIYLQDVETKSLKDAVNKRAKIPFFGYTKEARHFDTSEWSNHFYSPDVFAGREKYYWTVVG